MTGEGAGEAEGRCGLGSAAPYPNMHDCTCHDEPGHNGDGHWCPCGAAWRYCPDCGKDVTQDECPRCGYMFSLDDEPTSAVDAVMLQRPAVTAARGIQ